MSLLQRAFKTLGGLGLVVALPAAVLGQSTNSTNHYAQQGGEYAPAGNLPGDQAYPALSLGLTGGFLVWQDNITDGDGLGISAILLTNTFFAPYGSFRVNSQGAGDQENPQGTLLKGGGAAFVWQGGPMSFQHIYARFLSASNLWVAGDVQVNTATNFYQANPAITTLTNGNVVVAWGSYGQDNADGLQGVYAQILSPAGAKVGSEFLVNQFTAFNQRSPAIAAFPNGNFIIVWVSEQERISASVNGTGFANGGVGTNSFTLGASQASVDIYARIYNANGTPQGNEFLVNTANNTCANPAVAVASDGGYIIAWSQFDPDIADNNSWDVYARAFSATGVGGAAQVVNSQLYGDQFAPKISSVGSDFMVVWTSMGQDGSREGIYGQFLHEDGSHAGGEQRINTTVLNAQKFPTVASDGVERFLVAWSSFVGGGNSLDLYAQGYSSTLLPLFAPGAPYVTALDPYSLDVTWPPVVGYSLNYYELFVDGSLTPVILTNNLWANINYNPGSTHTFQLAYALTDGRISPLSTVASGTTWGQDRTGYLGFSDGLPDDWEIHYYGTNQNNWPKQGPATVLAPGVTVGTVFLWGADPNNSATWLKQTITPTPEGVFLNWNTVPGGIYQVMASTDLKTWTFLGSPRFEAGTTDSVFLGLSSKGYYQIVRNRY